MSTTPVVVDDSAVEKTFEDSRPANWWHLPVTTTVLGLLALVLFGLRGIPGVESVYVLARESDLNPFGIGIEVRGTKSPHWTGTGNSPATVGHFGMRGTAFWVDPAADLALVVGTSHDFCDAHREVMPRLADAVLEEHGG